MMITRRARAFHAKHHVHPTTQRKNHHETKSPNHQNHTTGRHRKTHRPNQHTLQVTYLSHVSNSNKNKHEAETHQPFITLSPQASMTGNVGHDMSSPHLFSNWIRCRCAWITSGMRAPHRIADRHLFAPITN